MRSTLARVEAAVGALDCGLARRRWRQVDPGAGFGAQVRRRCRRGLAFGRRRRDGLGFDRTDFHVGLLSGLRLPSLPDDMMLVSVVGRVDLRVRCRKFGSIPATAGRSRRVSSVDLEFALADRTADDDATAGGANAHRPAFMARTERLAFAADRKAVAAGVRPAPCRRRRTSCAAAGRSAAATDRRQPAVPARDPPAPRVGPRRCDAGGPVDLGDGQLRLIRAGRRPAAQPPRRPPAPAPAPSPAGRRSSASRLRCSAGRPACAPRPATRRRGSSARGRRRASCSRASSCAGSTSTRALRRRQRAAAWRGQRHRGSDGAVGQSGGGARRSDASAATTATAEAERGVTAGRGQLSRRMFTACNVVSGRRDPGVEMARSDRRFRAHVGAGALPRMAAVRRPYDAEARHGSPNDPGHRRHARLPRQVAGAAGRAPARDRRQHRQRRHARATRRATSTSPPRCATPPAAAAPGGGHRPGT